MKKTFLLLSVLICFCFADAQTYIYVHQDVNPASNFGNNQVVSVIIRDSNNDLWIYHVWADLDQSADAPFVMTKNALMRDNDYFAHLFNNSYYAKPSGFQPHPDQNLRHTNNGIGAYHCFHLMKMKENLTKCYVYYEVSTKIEYSIKKDFSVLVINSDKANPIYYKRVTVSDFQLRKSSDDLF